MRSEPNVEFSGVLGGLVSSDLHGMNREKECASILHSAAHVASLQSV